MKKFFNILIIFVLSFSLSINSLAASTNPRNLNSYKDQFTYFSTAKGFNSHISTEMYYFKSFGKFFNNNKSHILAVSQISSRNYKIYFFYFDEPISSVSYRKVSSNSNNDYEIISVNGKPFVDNVKYSYSSACVEAYNFIPDFIDGGSSFTLNQWLRSHLECYHGFYTKADYTAGNVFMFPTKSVTNIFPNMSAPGIEFTYLNSDEDYCLYYPFKSCNIYGTTLSGNNYSDPRPEPPDESSKPDSSEPDSSEPELPNYPEIEIPSGDSEYVPYDTSIWKKFFNDRLKDISVAMKVGFKIFGYIFGILLVFKMIRKFLK